MLGGFYTGASGMLMQQRVLNVLTNNFANVKTPGFQAERVISKTFDQEYLTRIEAGNTAVIGKGSAIRIVEDVPVEFDPSTLEQTDRPFDMAINGDGFFHIQIPQDENSTQANAINDANVMLTRNGNFDIDAEGYLILRGVGRVLGEKGEIQVKGSDFTVGTDGTVYDSQNKILDKLMVTVPGPDVVPSKTANGLYTVPDITQNTPSGVGVVQGWLERPNIDPNREMSLAMEAQRAFQACSNAMKIVDSMNQKCATQIASL